MSTAHPAVLFLCVHNAGRSQMAAALLAARAGDRIAVYSAGSAPGETLNQAVVTAMAELGLDISGEKPKGLTDDMALQSDVIVTMGCGDECPVYPGKRYVDWELSDPAGKDVDEVRTIRDDIALRVERLIVELVGEPGAQPARR
jgi:arsenate reductase (thioredoxin)